MPRGRFFGIAWAIALGGASLGGQVPATAQQETFRASVDIVRVDVSVLGRDRRPIRDLTAGDFEVRARATLVIDHHILDGPRAPLSAARGVPGSPPGGANREPRVSTIDRRQGVRQNLSRNADIGDRRQRPHHPDFR